MNIYKHLQLTLSEKNDFKDNVKSEEQKKVLELLKDANRELQKYYDGKYKFSLTNNSEESIDNIKKLSPKRKRKIKEIWLEFDSELCKLQRQYNSFLQKSIDNNEDA